MTFMFLRRLLREPLLHFVVLGAAVFVLERAVREEAIAPERLLILSAEREQQLVQTWIDKTGQPPAEADRPRMLAQWVDRELLYRKGLELSLDKEDSVVRNQVIRNTAFLLQRTAPVPTPGEDVLRAYLRVHRERYDEPERWDLEHAYVPRAQANASGVAEGYQRKLRSGTSVRDVGPAFPKGRALRRRSQDNLASIFGQAFARSVPRLAVNEWHIVTSRWGVHVVRVTGRYPPRSPAFESVRARLAHDWERDQRHRHVREQLERLRASHRVQRVDGSVEAATVTVSELDPQYALESAL